MMRRFALLIAAAGAAASCGGSALMQAATSGDRPTLEREIAAHEKAGDLTNSQAARVAKAVAEREIREAKGKDAVDRVRDVRACARELDGVLSDRMGTHDAAGAEAALARIDSGELGLGSARDSWGDADDAWRAVGARGLVREEDGDARRHAFGDPSPGVRRGALRAAQKAQAAEDLEALSESARLDPEPMIRSEAVRAIARLPGSQDVVNRLHDLWTGSDDGVREDIAIAWASPDIFANGGREALVILLASGHGPGVLEGAAAVVRGSYDSDKELYSTASANLLRAVDGGSTREKLHAVAALRVDRPEMLAALEKAATEDDPEVVVGALSRLVDSPKDRKDAVAKLEAYAALAKGGPGGGPLAERAKLVLAMAGDVRVQAWIEADLKSSVAYERLGAVSDLGALGRVARGAPVLADPDAGLRTRAACAILIGARGH